MSQISGREPASKEETTALLRELQAEMTTETAPLLQFLLKHAVLIMCVLGFFTLTLISIGVYQWYSDRQTRVAQEELGLILLNLQGKERVTALEAVLPALPKSVREAAYLELGAAAMAVSDYATAAGAYEKIMALDADSAVGLMAVTNHVQALIWAEQPEQALAVLNMIEKPVQQARSRGLVQSMTAEAAIAANQYDEAIQQYEALITTASGQEKEVLRSQVRRAQRAKTETDTK